MNILYLSSQELFKIQITASHNGVWKCFIDCTDDRCFKMAFIIFGDQEEHQIFSKDDNIFFLFYPVEVPSVVFMRYASEIFL